MQPTPENGLPDKQRLSEEELARAFSLFNQASAELTGAYAALQQQVEQLSEQLARANEELRRQLDEKAALSERLRTVLEALPAGVVLVGADGRVQGVNPPVAAILGEDASGQDWDVLTARRLRPTPTASEWLAERGGVARRLAVSESALADSGGRVVLLHDVTEARALEEKLARHQKLSAMGEMAAGLAHQLRTPLATAILYAGNLARPSLGEADRMRFAERALARMKHLEHMIQDMLTFVRGQPEVREDVPVAALLAELAQVMEPQMARAGVALQVEDACPGAAVQGSHKALASALTNLLENALQASGGSGAVRLAASPGEGGAVLISVDDAGPGIAEAARERLFEPFFTTRSDGTGLGLAIVRSVARAHGGDVRYEPRAGGGSRFLVELPALAGEDA